MSESLTIVIEESPARQDADFVREQLAQFNLLYSPPDNHQTLTLFLRDQLGGVVGGLLADTFWGWLHIDIFWVAEEHRGRGYGKQLLKMAEQEAVRRGCRSSHLETHSFQSLAFYQKRGYTIFAELADFPPGHVKYFLKKELSGAEA